MIVVKEFTDREFSTKEELFKALKENKKSLIALKKSIEKRADAFSYSYSTTIENNVNKEELNYNTEIDKLQVKVVINTTNFIDSHNDLHINGIWNKSVSDNANKGFLHLQEHDRDFDKVISDNAIGTIETLTWKSLGFPYNGKTIYIFSRINCHNNFFLIHLFRKRKLNDKTIYIRIIV